MASSKEYLEFILGQLSELEEITYRAMMGEFIIYYRGKIVGGIYDDRLLVKPVKSAISYMPTAPYELPYEGAKEMLLVDEVDNKEFLTGLFHAMYDELPALKPKKRNKQFPVCITGKFKFSEEKYMKKKIKILIALIVGFALAMLLMSVAIYFGYTNAYSTDVNTLTVKILGIPIYELTKSGTEYIGKSIGVYMGAVCGICMAISVIAEELISKARHK